MDDLVAELTLRIRNEMNAGFDQVREGFSGLQDEAALARAEVTGLDTAMRALVAPAALADGFADLIADAKATTAAVDDIGVAILGDIDKIRQMHAEWGQFAVPPAISGENYPQFIPPGTAPPGEPPEEPPPEPVPGDGGRPAKGGGGIDGAELLGGAVAGFTGYDSFKQYAAYQSTLGQAVTTEKLHGDAYDAELSRLQDMMDMLALRYNASSQDLASAYKYLITTGLPAAQVDALMPSLAEASTAHAIDVTDMQGAVFALADSFKISPEQMGAALAQLGYATKMGHFTAESFGAFLPSVGGALATAGVTGPDAADYTFAALETIVKNVSIPSEAATDYTDLIHYIGTQHAERSFLQLSRMMLPQMRDIFAKYGIAPADLYGMENAAVAEGKDPIQTVLDYVHMATAKMTPTDRNAAISDWFTNQQGGDAVRALMLHWDDGVGPDGQVVPGYQSDFKNLQGVTQQTLDDDFQNALQNSSADLKTFDENLSQASRTLGYIFDHTVVAGANVVFNPGAGPVTSPGFWEPPSNTPWLGVRSGHPMQIHITVAPDGTPTSVRATPPPGVNLRVNQGSVLNTP